MISPIIVKCDFFHSCFPKCTIFSINHIKTRISGVVWCANRAIAFPPLFSLQCLSLNFIVEKDCLTGKNLLL